jgi:hypothetical protein
LKCSTRDDSTEAWYRLATRCAAQIRKQCGALSGETEQRILRVFRAALRTRRPAGRKPDRETVQAAELWTAGMLRYPSNSGEQSTLKRYQRGLWQRIYRDVLPGFAGLDKLTRQYRTTALRRNVKAYLNRKSRKSPRAIRVPTTTRKAKRVVSVGGHSAAD